MKGFPMRAVFWFDNPVHKGYNNGRIRVDRSMASDGPISKEGMTA